jgi:hypothetical protein
MARIRHDFPRIMTPRRVLIALLAASAATGCRPTMPTSHLPAVQGRGPDVFVIDGGKRYWIPNTSTFFALRIDPADVRVISDRDLYDLPSGGALPEAHDGLLLVGSGPEIYLYEGGARHLVPDEWTFEARGLHREEVRRVPDEVLSAFPEGAPIASQ